MPECQGCGEHVSARWAQAQSDNDGVVHGCPACQTTAALLAGAAAGQERRLVGGEGPR